MKCHECGGEVAAGASFCSQCGARLDGDAHSEDDALHHDHAAGAPQYRAGGAHGPGRDVPEEELWSGSYSPKAMVGPFVGAGVLVLLGLIGASFAGPIGWTVVLACAAVGFGWLGLMLLYRKMTVRCRLTTFRFFSETGLLSRTNDRIQVISIDDVRMTQGPIDRMFGVGTIILQSKDTSNPELKLSGIEDARHVADLIDGARRAKHNRRALYTADM